MNPNRIRLDNVRLSFNDLFVAKKAEGSDTARFSAHFLMAPNHPQVADVRRIALAMAEAKWPGKGQAVMAGIEGTEKFCLRRGETKQYAGYEGMLFISANSKKRPLVVDTDRTPLDATSGRPYSGCYVNGVIEIYAFKHATGGMQVNADLISVQFRRDGDAFGGSAPGSVEEFENLAVGETVDDLV